MKKEFVLLFLVCFFSCTSGFLSFGSDEETISPTPEQVAICRNEMYLNQILPIEPLGYKLLGSGIDDAIWFKFKTEEKNISEYFSKNAVNTDNFKHDFQMFPEDISWWDVENKKFFGGNAELPNVKFMTIAIEEKTDYNVVYIMWHET
ncbi:MAG: hypothetical protein JW982_03795 [Spirochaetes bacterium]|nr:hypothetical protein [Spirochaetota bacterium]